MSTTNNQDIILINEIWKILKPILAQSGDTTEAAELLVNYMVDEDYLPADIKQAFRTDKDIKTALEYYIETTDDGLYNTHEEVDPDLEDYEDFSSYRDRIYHDDDSYD